MDIKTIIISKASTAFVVTIIFGYFGGKFLYNYFKDKLKNWLFNNPKVSNNSNELVLAYNILGCTEKSSITEIKLAYKKLAKMYHPDSSKNKKEAEARFLKIKEAYEKVLADKKIGPN
ncbi:MAG: J domain-containing protein [Bacteriovoracaceae bacterium]